MERALATPSAGQDFDIGKYLNLVKKPPFICDGIKRVIIETMQVSGIFKADDAIVETVTPNTYYESPAQGVNGEVVSFNALTHNMRVLYADRHFPTTKHKAAIYVWQTRHLVEIFFLYIDGDDTMVGSLSKYLHELHCSQIDCRCHDNCKNLPLAAAGH